VADDQSLITNEDTSINITLTATDPDGDSLTYFVVTKPAHGSLSNLEAGTNKVLAQPIKYTPSANYNGADSFTFKANDGISDSNTATVSLTINPVDDIPQLTQRDLVFAIEPEENSVSKTYLLCLLVTEVDGDTLTYAVQNLPSFVHLDPNTGELTLSITHSNINTYTNVIFTVKDVTPAGLSATKTFNLIIREAKTYYCDAISNVSIANVSGNIAGMSRFVSSDLDTWGLIVEDITPSSQSMKYSPLIGTLQQGDVVRVGETYNVNLGNIIYVAPLEEALYVNTGDPAGNYVIKELMAFEGYVWQEGDQITITEPAHLAGTYTIAAKVSDDIIRLTTQAGDGVNNAVTNDPIKTDRFLHGTLAGLKAGDFIYAKRSGVTAATGIVVGVSGNTLTFRLLWGTFQEGDEIENTRIIVTTTSSPTWNKDGQTITINGTPVANGNTQTGLGTSENPWGTLQSAKEAGKLGTYAPWKEGMVKSGDTVKLRTGFHGKFEVSKFTPTDYISIEADTGAIPDVNSASIQYTSYWKLKNLRINPVSYDPDSSGNLVQVYASHHITIEDCNIFTVTDDISANWTPRLWYKMFRPVVKAGIWTENGGKYLIFRGNVIHNVLRGVSSGGCSYTLIENNTINNFVEDALHLSGPYMTIQDNVITNVWNDARSWPHPDSIQGGEGNDGTGDIIRRNYVSQCTDPNRDLRRIGGLQGFFGMWGLKNALIENNVIMASNIVWGIAISSDCDNVKVLNNTLVQSYAWSEVSRYGYGTPPGLNIMVGTGAKNIIIRNNIARDVPASNISNNIVSDHNFDIRKYKPLDEFADYIHGNMRLAAGSHFIDAGESADAPAEDLERNSRPQGQGYDVGAYEYGASTTSLLYGDVNSDGEISAYDAALAAHIAVDLEHPDIKNRAAADVSGDGQVTAYDAALIAQRAVGLIEKFPVEG
jgi:hypothetical protein